MNLSLRKRALASFAVAAALATSSSLIAQTVIFEDDFNGAGDVDITKWRLPFDTEGNFVGQTLFRGDTTTDLPQQSGGSVKLTLDTFSPVDPGNAFIGHDLLTKRNFARGGGLRIESRMRLDPASIPSGVGGVVNGFFLFDVTRDSPPGANNLVRDEIDWELLTNEVRDGTDRPATNLWNDGPIVGPGSGGSLMFENEVAVDLTAFQDYRIDWTPNRVDWFINNTLVRTATGADVPDDPMKLHFNIWAADSGFTDAFDGALLPAATVGANQQIISEVDSVTVTRFNTDTSANLLNNASFESALPAEQPIDILNASVTPTTTDRWIKFGNVFVEGDTGFGSPGPAPDGIFAAKAFGPFGSPGDASGLLQRVAAAPGEEFEASLFAGTGAADSILGTDNFNLLQLRFLNSAGTILEEAFADPSDIVQSNSNDFPLLDGRDPLATNDTYFEGVVSAIAPAGTAFVELGIFFIQLDEDEDGLLDGGATWYDNASLVKLTAQAAANLVGDFNGDGVVDGGDYAFWRNNLGTGAELAGTGDGSGTLDAGDLPFWVGNFGDSSTPGAITAGVPEPTAVVLCLSVVLPWLGGRRRV